MVKIVYNIDTLKTTSSSISDSFESAKTSCDSSISALKKINEIKNGSVDKIISSYEEFMADWEDLSNKLVKYTKNITDLENSIIDGTYLGDLSSSKTNNTNNNSTSKTATNTSTTSLQNNTTTMNSFYGVYGTNYSEEQINDLMNYLKKVLKDSGYNESNSNFIYLCTKMFDSIINKNNEFVYKTLIKLISLLKAIPNTKLELDVDSDIFYNTNTFTMHIGLDMLNENSKNYDENKFYITLSGLIDQCVNFFEIEVSVNE